MKLYVITVIRHTRYVCLGYLYKLKSPYNSFYIYVCSDWNDAYDKGANLRYDHL